VLLKPVFKLDLFKARPVSACIEDCEIHQALDQVPKSLAVSLNLFKSEELSWGALLRWAFRLQKKRAIEHSHERGPEFVREKGEEV
jgi:hypothetical protein